MLEKFEKWVINSKKKIDPRVLGVIAFAVVGICIMFGLQMANLYKRAKQITTDENNNTLYELIGYVKNVDVLVKKARIVTSKEFMTTTYTDILRQTNLAKAMLARLPVDQNSMQMVSEFLVQVADFSYSCVKKLAKGEVISKEYYANLKVINEYSNKLSDTLGQIYQELVTGYVRWDEVDELSKKKLEEQNLSMWLQGIETVSKTFTNYEGLIYDGAYSSHLEQETSKLLSQNKVSVEYATAVAQKAVQNMTADIQIANTEYIGEINGNIELYEFKITPKHNTNGIYIQITQEDGFLYQMIYDRNVKTEKQLEHEELEKKALEYLKIMGYDNMKATYYLKDNGMFVINMAAVQDTIVMYPDLIKIKLAMDNGEVCSVEAKGYVYNHTIRSNTTPQITQEQAQNVTNEEIDISYVGMAIIANEYNKEVLTYEIKGVVEEREYIVYINATTGIEENVFLIIETPGGKLAM